MAAVLVTGRPRSGKTTLVRAVLDAIAVPAAGFYTVEVRGAGGERTGFELVTLAGERATLAAAGLDSPHRVGRYGVDLATVERVGVPAIEAGIASDALVVIDEIGAMELLSSAFQRVVIEAVRRSRLVLGTVMQRPHPFADELKAQHDTLLFELTAANRDDVRGLVEAQLRASTGQFSV